MFSTELRKTKFLTVSKNIAPNGLIVKESIYNNQVYGSNMVVLQDDFRKLEKLKSNDGGAK